MKSARTIITISEQEKRWLAAYSGLHGVSLEKIRVRALAAGRLRAQDERASVSSIPVAG